MANKLVPTPGGPQLPDELVAAGLSRLPGPIRRAGERASSRFIKFFTAKIHDCSTRAAYALAVGRFFQWCEAHRIELPQVDPFVIVKYVDTHRKSVPAIEQQIAAIRMLFDHLVAGHVVEDNPASCILFESRTVTTASPRVRVKVAIQYEPGCRGIHLALAYCRVRRGAGPFFDLYGYCIGYEGGGVYDNWSFHVGEHVDVGFISYTPAAWGGGGGWADDGIGVSGLARQEFADGVEPLLDLVQDRLMTRWCCWDDEGDPDLRPAAKRRLNCERRRGLYRSPGFDEDLLAFLSPVWPISLTFGAEAEERARWVQKSLARRRARRRGFVAALVKYPQLIETGLRLLNREALGRCGRTKLVFASDQGGELVVACQWEQVTERDGERITTLKRDLLSSENGKTRLMVVSTSIDSAVRQLLDQEAISWREIPRKEFRHFLSEEGDLNLSELFLTKNTP